ncbi:MAG: hypothetical protein AAB434_03330 [Planctomycetota bacterium]
MPWSSRRRNRRWWRLAILGVAPILAGVAVLWDAIERRSRLALAPPSDAPVSMRRLPWEQQLVIIELVASFGLIVGGVLIATIILSGRRS